MHRGKPDLYFYFKYFRQIFIGGGAGIVGKINVYIIIISIVN